MRDKLNCPNCGAPITGVECEYCGSRFHDMADLDLDKGKNYIRIRRGDNIFTCKVMSVCTEIKGEAGSYPCISLDFYIVDSKRLQK